LLPIDGRRHSSSKPNDQERNAIAIEEYPFRLEFPSDKDIWWAEISAASNVSGFNTKKETDYEGHLTCDQNSRPIHGPSAFSETHIVDLKREKRKKAGRVEDSSRGWDGSSLTDLNPAFQKSLSLPNGIFSSALGDFETHRLPCCHKHRTFMNTVLKFFIAMFIWG
jgi:hypothetical protein